MQVVETKSEGLSREFNITVAAADVEEKVTLRLSEVAKQASLPGFRPGKVPVSLLRKRYGPNIMGEVLEQVVNDSSMQAMGEKGIRPAGQPQIEIVTFEEGKDLEYKIAVDILPDIEPMDFSKLKLERMVLKPDEKEIRQALENLANAHKSSEPIKDKRKSKSGDVVVIDFVGKVDGEEFPGGKADGYHLELGSNSFIPGFEDQLIGANVGDDVEVKVKFPDEYGAKELAGKDAVFECKVHEIRETAPAAIDDDLAKKAGLENLDQLKERIVDSQRQQFDEMARMVLKRGLLDKLADGHNFDIPPRMAEQEFDAIWKQYEEHLKEGDHEGHDHAEKSEEENKAEFREIADRRVKLGLLLSEVGRVNEVQVSQEDVNRAIIREAQKYPGQEQQILEYLRNDPNAQEQLKAPIYEDKVIDYIIELADITDKEATFDEMIAAMEAEDEGNAKKKPAKKKTPAKKKAAAKKDGDKDKGDAKKKTPAKKKTAAKKAEK